jgi:hypothetical protein
MVAPNFTKLSAQTFSLEDIVGEVRSGGVRIPEFQRLFKWQWEDARRLMDSIVRGYPIGSLLLWSRSAPASNITLGSLQINAPRKDEALWVVDGQQRLTSLASALDWSGAKDPRFAIAYDLAQADFIKPTDARLHIISLPDIFDLQLLLKWFSEHPESAEYFEEATRVTKAIRQYSIPAYIVKQEAENDLRDIFDRMNNYGKRLTRAEVFSALHGGSSGDNPPRTLSDIVTHIAGKYSFGEIDEDTVLHAILARRAPDVTRDIRVEFSSSRGSRSFPNETADEAYRAAEKALERAVDFLQNEAYVPQFSFLTYRYLLVVLTRFFAHHPQPNPRNIELLRRWFWRAAIVGPEVFSGWTQAMRSLGSLINPNNETDSIQDLLKAISSFTLKPLKISNFRSTSASSRILLCAMWALNPKSFKSSQPYSIYELGSSLEGEKTAKRVLPVILNKGLDSGRARAANRFILLGDDSIEDAREQFRNKPNNMTDENWELTLKSHAIDLDMVSCLVRKENIQFLDLREAKLRGIVEDFLSLVTESSFEDTPPLSTFDLDDDDDDLDDDDELNDEHD